MRCSFEPEVTKKSLHNVCLKEGLSPANTAGKEVAETLPLLATKIIGQYHKDGDGRPQGEEPCV